MNVRESKEISETQLARCVQTLNRAFDGYSLMRHFLAEDDHEQRVRRYQETFLRKVGMTVGHVWATDDGTALSIWTSPDIEDAEAVFTPLSVEFEKIAGARANVMQASEAIMAKARPEFPCWFLGAVAVDPDFQGKGLSRAVIEPGLERAEREGFPVFLETSDEKNVRLYEHLGFKITASYLLPFNGPMTYAMIR
ncbi:GNAT family N-acetyltransferase [Xenorhabdus innexi]|uniref:Puromycin N-acetyltransferase n=1 Tax=Xenorhabdus innexi TaxID=290109 RepID=A0A1N6MVV9_9GAMM|nr:GNAT family N-acetyltransferase [Xenorhabdus innexi]PHM35745.1 RecName: FullPuromycin N-acetyltransferase [Xenorhabdus innexi]SIP72917.1 Puromycin N-acetyltransferase [Xenorhabdus innexi]